MQKIMRGKPVAESLRDRIRQGLDKKSSKITLAIVIVGNDPASYFYKDHLFRLSDSLGIKTKEIILHEDATTEEVLTVIGKLNKEKAVQGILPMMPMPAQIDAQMICKAIYPTKDVDCLNPENAGELYLGQSFWGPCTARAVMATLKYYAVPLTGKNVVIIGRSNVVGKPLVPLLLAENATVTICHSKTQKLSQITAQADIIIAAVGVAGFVKADMVNERCLLVDVGINETKKGIVGDISDEANEKVLAYTPVPGGIGTVSSMMVMDTLINKN